MGVGVAQMKAKSGAKRQGALRAPLIPSSCASALGVQGHVAVGGAGVKLEPLASNERWAVACILLSSALHCADGVGIVSVHMQSN